MLKVSLLVCTNKTSGLQASVLTFYHEEYLDILWNKKYQYQLDLVLFYPYIANPFVPTDVSPLVYIMQRFSFFFFLR